VQINQLENQIDEKAKNFHGYQTWYDGYEGNGVWRDAYERKAPAAFDKDHEERDTFTSKMIYKFAVEGTDKDTKKPNG
tara:strand:- start:327 stop:560 length:234 start_codon:yes stop_codon:yes gene_type:complete